MNINKRLSIYLIAAFLAVIFALSGCDVLGLNFSNITGGDTSLGVEGPSIDALSVGKKVDAASEIFLENTADRYGAYFEPDEYQNFLNSYYGSYGGIGVYLTQGEDGRTMIISVMPGRPADGAGILAGDIILAVDGEDVTEMDTDFIVTKIKGEAGTEVKLTVEREDGEKKQISLYRDTIEVTSVEGNFLPADKAGADGIAYIQIYDFTEKTVGQFVTLFNELSQEKDIEGIIFDLRNNGGGSFNAAIQMAEYFIAEDEVVVAQKKRDGTEYTYSNGGQLIGLPVVTLQNGYTASASEVMIGALKDHNAAQVVGDLSYGKGITQLILKLSSGAGLRFTESRYLTPSGYDLHGVGIYPDIYAGIEPPVTLEQIRSQDPAEDAQLAAAINALKERL
jgi:carboxyl-terminal processing protease